MNVFRTIFLCSNKAQSTFPLFQRSYYFFCSFFGRNLVREFHSYRVISPMRSRNVWNADEQVSSLAQAQRICFPFMTALNCCTYSNFCFSESNIAAHQDDPSATAFPYPAWHLVLTRLIGCLFIEEGSFHFLSASAYRVQMQSPVHVYAGRILR